MPDGELPAKAWMLLSGVSWRTRREAVADLMLTVPGPGTYALVRLAGDGGAKVLALRVRAMQRPLFTRMQRCPCGQDWSAVVASKTDRCPNCRAQARRAAFRALHTPTPEVA